ncbi:MAG: hypothetical protein GQ574_17990 [Crocinitomix sp.]|nr:hypothetical protein [Crocinitomix sp.]
MKERKIGRRIFIIILTLQAIFELVIGGSLLIDLPATLKAGFGITHTSDFDIIGLALGLYLLLLTGLMILSIVWTIKRNFSGITLGIIIGVFLFLFGVMSFFKTGETGGLLGDSIRGVITVVFAYLANKELKKVNG